MAHLKKNLVRTNSARPARCSSLKTINPLTGERRGKNGAKYKHFFLRATFK